MIRTGPDLQDVCKRSVCPIHSNASHMDMSENVHSPIGMDTMVVSCGAHVRGRRLFSSSGAMRTVECVAERESSLIAMTAQSARDDSSSVIRDGMDIGLISGSIKTQSSLCRSVAWFVSSCCDAYVSAPKREGKTAPYRALFRFIRGR